MPSQFMQLPAEIREEILRLVLGGDFEITASIGMESLFLEHINITCGDQAHPSAQILRVNKQLSDEGRRILYKERVARVYYYSKVPEVLKRLEGKSKLPEGLLIRNVVFPLVILLYLTVERISLFMAQLPKTGHFGQLESILSNGSYMKPEVCDLVGEFLSREDFEAFSCDSAKEMYRFLEEEQHFLGYNLKSLFGLVTLSLDKVGIKLPYTYWIQVFGGEIKDNCGSTLKDGLVRTFFYASKKPMVSAACCGFPDRLPGMPSLASELAHLARVSAFTLPPD